MPCNEDKQQSLWHVKVKVFTVLPPLQLLILLISQLIIAPHQGLAKHVIQLTQYNNNMQNCKQNNVVSYM